MLDKLECHESSQRVDKQLFKDTLQKLGTRMSWWDVYVDTRQSSDHQKEPPNKVLHVNSFPNAVPSSL